MNNNEISKFLKDLSGGKIDGQKYNINKIIYSKDIGIGWLKI